MYSEPHIEAAGQTSSLFAPSHAAFVEHWTMKKRVILVVTCVAAFAGALVVSRFYPTEAAPEVPAAVPAVPVNTARVQVGDTPVVLTGIGTVQPYNVVDVHTQVTGTIQQIAFVEGQTVRKGDLIAQLDPRPYQAALQQAEANLARDEAQLTNAQVNLDRYTPLLKHGFASAQQVTDQQAQVTQLQASVAAGKAAIFNAQTQLSYTSITSPIDGVTGIRQVDIGNIVQPSTSTPIVTITQIQPISVVFTLPQKDIPGVQAAMATATLKTLSYDQNDQTALDEGSLLLVNNTISQSSGTAQLKATFPNAKRALWPGEFVNVHLVVAEQHDGITVPLSAVQHGQSGPYVFIVQPDDSARIRPVTVDETFNGRALIDQGLHAGDTVVTAGQYRLDEGVKVASVSAGDPRVQNTTQASAGML
jgi:membrane fusion protein, multidrug efflux system